MDGIGVTARIAYGIMLQTRDKLIDMHATLGHDHIDHLMGDLANDAEALKSMVAMMEAAYCRVLAAASAHQLAGGKFVINGKPQRVRAS
jgi:hypothetical protein